MADKKTVVGHEGPCREYHRFSKHKGHSPKGTRCPVEFEADKMQELLDNALPDERNNRIMYNIYKNKNVPGIIAFRKEWEGRYHGYPLSSKDVPTKILNELCERNGLELQDRRRLFKGL